VFGDLPRQPGVDPPQVTAEEFSEQKIGMTLSKSPVLGDAHIHPIAQFRGRGQLQSC